VNNPSNPTGAVYSEEHLMQIIRVAEKWNVPIVADEIYGDLTFGSNVFYPMANVVSKLGYSVPVITASGLGKQCKSLSFSMIIIEHILIICVFIILVCHLLLPSKQI
jgi:aspartate/methionine/tyrosine aminotransferase